MADICAIPFALAILFGFLCGTGMATWVLYRAIYRTGGDTLLYRAIDTMSKL